MSPTYENPKRILSLLPVGRMYQPPEAFLKPPVILHLSASPGPSGGASHFAGQRLRQRRSSYDLILKHFILQLRPLVDLLRQQRPGDKQRLFLRVRATQPGIVPIDVCDNVILRFNVYDSSTSTGKCPASQCPALIRQLNHLHFFPMIVFASFDDQLFHSVILCSGHVVNNPTLPRNVTKIATRQQNGEEASNLRKVADFFITNITKKGVDKRAKKCGEALRDVETRRERCRWTNTHMKSSRN